MCHQHILQFYNNLENSHHLKDNPRPIVPTPSLLPQALTTTMYLLCEPACSGAHEGACTVWSGPPILEAHPQCDINRNFSPLDSRGHPDGWLVFCLFIRQLRDMHLLPPLDPHDLTAAKGQMSGHTEPHYFQVFTWEPRFWVM